jgi:hypothetical protein
LCGPWACGSIVFGFAVSPAAVFAGFYPAIFWPRRIGWDRPLSANLYGWYAALMD